MTATRRVEGRSCRTFYLFGSLKIYSQDPPLGVIICQLIKGEDSIILFRDVRMHDSCSSECFNFSNWWRFKLSFDHYNYRILLRWKTFKDNVGMLMMQHWISDNIKQIANCFDSHKKISHCLVIKRCSAQLHAQLMS